MLHALKSLNWEKVQRMLSIEAESQIKGLLIIIIINEKKSYTSEKG